MKTKNLIAGHLTVKLSVRLKIINHTHHQNQLVNFILFIIFSLFTVLTKVDEFRGVKVKNRVYQTINWMDK